MKTIKLKFNPDDLQPGNEAWSAFQAGGVTLKFWALYKNTHATSQYFEPFLEQLAKYFRDAFNPEVPDIKPYSNIDEFMSVLWSCGMPMPGQSSTPLCKWVVNHWDYFNLNVQRSIALEYEVIEPVTKRQIIGWERD